MLFILEFQVPSRKIPRAFVFTITLFILEALGPLWNDLGWF